MFDNLYNTIGMDNGIVDNLRSPSVAVRYAVAIDNALTVDSITSLPFRSEGAIVGMNTIAHDKGVDGVTNYE